MIHERAGRLTLKLPELKVSRPVSGIVSVRNLVPPKAQKERLRAQRAHANGKSAESIQHLKRAIRIHPDYLQAHNNPGVRYRGSGDFDRTALAFGKAVKLDPSSAQAHANLTLTLVALKRYAEAEVSARRALQFEPDRLKARCALGLTDAANNNCTQEAAQNLNGAAEEFPKARLTAAHALAYQGNRGEAATQ